ncbi:MAG: hypothetical protein ACKO37_00360 [Vampirovibrionales bacterium]
MAPLTDRYCLMLRDTLLSCGLLLLGCYGSQGAVLIPHAHAYELPAETAPLSVSSPLPPPTRVAVFESIQAQQNQYQTQEQQGLQMLWQAAVSQSAPIRLALERIQQPTLGTQQKSSGQKVTDVARGVVKLGALTGSMLTGSPLGLMSGQVVDQALRPVDNPGRSMAQLPMNDTDIVLLTKEIELLQHQLMNRYSAYRYWSRMVSQASQAKRETSQDFQEAYQKLIHQEGIATFDAEHHPVVQLMQAQFDQLSDQLLTYQQQALQAREALVLMVGQATMKSFDADFQALLSHH